MSRTWWMVHMMLSMVSDAPPGYIMHDCSSITVVSSVPGLGRVRGCMSRSNWVSMWMIMSFHIRHIPICRFV
jgi:hypothetical protein